MMSTSVNSCEQPMKNKNEIKNPNLFHIKTIYNRFCANLCRDSFYEAKTVVVF